MNFTERLEWLKAQHEALITRKNEPIEGNGVYERYKNPIITAEHAPLFWRYDLNPETNPYLMERFGIHATMNSGAIKWNGKYVLVVRVEAADRKSFFAVAESPNGVDNFRFWDHPITMPEYGEPATNIYDMRLTAHEDGWIYGIFCVERKDPSAAPGDLSSAVAAASSRSRWISVLTEAISTVARLKRSKIRLILLASSARTMMSLKPSLAFLSFNTQ